MDDLWIIYGYWLVVKSTPLKKIRVAVKVKWDDYSQLNGKIKVMFQSTNQITSLVCGETLGIAPNRSYLKIGNMKTPSAPDRSLLATG